MVGLSYHEPGVPDDDELAAALVADDTRALCEMVIGLTTIGDDEERAVDAVRRLITHPHEDVRGNAVLAVGHAARVFRSAAPDLLAHVRAALDDPSAYVRGHASSAADDVRTSVGVDVRVPPQASQPGRTSPLS